MAEHGETIVHSPIGDVAIDSGGATVGVVRMDPAQSYVQMPELLKEVIDAGSDSAWQAIKQGIDYTYASLDAALSPLRDETHFDRLLREELAKGKKLLFKPNLVNALAIDSGRHGPGEGYATCTAWPFVAALMRWLHDKLDISYHQMAVGEASTSMAANAAPLSQIFGRPFTRQAVMEGRAGEFYAGWGFYFARRYLAETHDPSHTDDPMAGYDDSVAGNYLPPGRAMDRLPVYDLNRIQDIPNSGRRVPVPGAANFDAITLHKVVIGGDPADPADLRDYPGCVLINVPKLKVHQLTLLTNALKNLGIGLYPMEAAEDSDPNSTRWMYSSPHMPLPGMKSGLPHQIWTAEADDVSGLPGAVRRTAGINGSIVDMVSALQDQGVRVLNVADAIEMINFDHTLSPAAERVPEGYRLRLARRRRPRRRGVPIYVQDRSRSRGTPVGTRREGEVRIPPARAPARRRWPEYRHRRGYRLADLTRCPVRLRREPRDRQPGLSRRRGGCLARRTPGISPGAFRQSRQRRLLGIDNTDSLLRPVQASCGTCKRQ